MAESVADRGLDVDGLAGMVSPMYAVLAGHAAGGSSAGPAAGALRLAVRRFLGAVRNEVSTACERGLSASSIDPMVAASARSGVASVLEGYRVSGRGAPASLSATHAGEAARAGERARGLIAGAARGAERRLSEIRAHLAPLAKFVDGAHVLSVGAAAAPLYPRLARAVVLASLSGAAVFTLTDGAHARPTAVEIQAQQAQVSVDDLFRASFGGAVAPVAVPGSVKPSTGAPVPAQAPVANTGGGVAAPFVPTRAPGLEGPSPVFRTMAKAFLRIHGGNGDRADQVLDRLILDARACTERFGSDMRCKVYRDDVGIDLARGRFEIRNPDGTGALLVSEERGGDMRMLDPTGYSTVLQGGDHFESRPADRSRRRVAESGKAYFEPSQAFIKMALPLVQLQVGDARESDGRLADVLSRARACAGDPARAGSCAVSALGMSIDMEKGDFTLSAPLSASQEPVLLVRETAATGFQVVNPTAIAKVMRRILANGDLVRRPQPTEEASSGLGPRMR